MWLYGFHYARVDRTESVCANELGNILNRISIYWNIINEYLTVI